MGTGDPAHKVQYHRHQVQRQRAAVGGEGRPRTRRGRGPEHARACAPICSHTCGGGRGGEGGSCREAGEAPTRKSRLPDFCSRGGCLCCRCGGTGPHDLLHRVARAHASSTAVDVVERRSGGGALRWRRCSSRGRGSTKQPEPVTLYAIPVTEDASAEWFFFFEAPRGGCS